MRDSTTREDDLADIGKRLADITGIYGRRSITVRFLKLTPELIAGFTEWDVKRFGLLSGNECYFIYATDETPDAKEELLYVVNVTCDSLMTAAYELMDLLARKF